MNDPQDPELNLAGPCGFYCGTCRHYLARSKGLLKKEKHLKDGCKGCRAQDKKCAWVKRDCVLLRKHQIAFCFECPDFPCENLKKFDERHIRDDQLAPSKICCASKKSARGSGWRNRLRTGNARSAVGICV